MTTELHRERALNHLAASAAVHEALTEIRAEYHEIRDNGRTANREVAAARKVHEAEWLARQGQKLAEIHSLLYIGEQLERLAHLLRPVVTYEPPVSAR